MPVDRARSLFRARFGCDPQAIAVAPGRVNLIGEHVDYAEGVVLPIAIERRTAVAMAATEGDSRFVSEAFPQEVRRSLTHEGVPIVAEDALWANYVLGPLAELRERDIAVPEVQVAVASDVSLGGGMSSSAAVEVATMLAALRIARASLDGVAIAALCQQAEHCFAGTPCGIMDMTVSANAKEGHALFLDCRTLAMRHVPMPLTAVVAVIDSGVRHRLSDGGYASRRAAVEDAARVLGVHSLRDASLDAVLSANLDETVRKRARHVVTEIARAIEGAAALERSDVSRFGALMNETHASLRDDFAVSVPEIETIVAAAQRADGVYGARLTGGGFGGSVVALVDRSRAERALASISRSFEASFGRVPPSFVTSARGGARLI